MSAASVPPTTLATAPPKDETATPSATATFMPPAGFMPVLGGLAVLPIVFLLVFHGGAAYLSYQKYQSGLWAVLDFIFAYFYYPYYAFFLSGSSPSMEASPINTMMGGMRKLFKAVRKH